jgi:hypothetical protein
VIPYQSTSPAANPHLSRPHGRFAKRAAALPAANLTDQLGRSETSSKKYGRAPGIPWVTDNQHADNGFEVEARYWMMEHVAKKRLAATIGDRAMVVYRDVTSTWRNSRSIKAALLFPTPVTHKLPILAVSPERAHLFLALVNSIVFDFLARVHVPGGSLTPWVISQCAAPPPEAFDPACAELAERLSVTSRKLAEAYSFTLHYEWDSQTERSLVQAIRKAGIPAPLAVH